MMRFGLFQFGLLYYAIPLLQVVKIVQDATLYRLPRLPEAVSGVLVDAGMVIPVLDLNAVSGHVPTGGGSSYQVLVDSEYGQVALRSELSSRIVLEKKGELVEDVTDQEAWVTGVFKYAGEDYKILDINFLAIEMTQKMWREQSDSSDVRRHS